MGHVSGHVWAQQQNSGLPVPALGSAGSPRLKLMCSWDEVEFLGTEQETRLFSSGFSGL